MSKRYPKPLSKATKQELLDIFDKLTKDSNELRKLAKIKDNQQDKVANELNKRFNGEWGNGTKL